MAVSAEASRPNFNPDWMNVPKQNCPTFSSSSTCAANHIPPDLADNGYGGAIVGVSNDLATVVMAPPKLAKNRYSREEMLALFDSRMLAPDRLSRDFEDFFSATNLAQSPFCTLPLTTLEQQYLSLGGVNSNKALKDVIHAEHRLDPTVTAQPPVAVSLPGGPSSVPHHHQQQQQDSPSSGAGGGHQSRWASIGSNSGGGFGSIGGFGRGFSHDVHTPSGGSGGFGGGFRPRGGHSYGFGGVGRGRGFSFSGATQSRPFGGGGGGPPSEPVNRRAQGFYQATNSVNKERYPRQRLTSNSDHTSSGGGGINEFAKSSQSGSVGGRWNNLTTETGSSTTTTGTSYHPPIQKGSLKLPEWATDDDDELDANNNDNHNNNNNNNNNDISHSSNNNKNNRKNVNDKDVVKEESRNNKNDQWSSVDSGGSFDADGNFVKGSVLPKPPPPIKYSDVDDKVKKVASSHISSSNANSTLLTSAQPRRVPQTFASVAGSRSTATKSIMNELAITSQTTQPFVQTNNTLTQSRASNNDQSFKHSSDPSTQVTISSISMPLSPAISSDLAAKILAIPNANPPISANRNVKITTESDLLRNLHKQAQNLVENVCVENSDNSLVKCQQQTVQSQQAGSFSSNNAQSLSDTWYYRDPQGTLQGPFASDMMAAWFKAGYFSMQLMIRNANDSNFATLGDWINRLGANPFMACQQLAINQQERIVSSQSQTVTAQSQSAIVNQLHAPNVATQSQVVGQQSRQVTPSCWNQQTTGSQDIYNYQPTSTVSATMTSACSWGIDAKGTNSSTSSIKTGHNAIYQQPIHSQNLDQNQVSTTKQQIQLDIGGTPAALNAQQIEQNLKQMLEQFKKAEQAKLEEQKKSLEADRKRLQELEEKILRETEEKTKKLQEAEDLLRKQRKETARIQEAQKREIEERRRLELETQEKLRLAEEKAAENLKRTKEEQGRRLLFERLKWETEVDAQQADQRKRNFEEQQRLVEEQGRQSEEAERLRLVRIQKEQEESESRRLEEQKRHILFDQLKSNSMAKENNYNQQQQQQLHQVNHSTNFAPWAKNLGEKPSSNLAIGNSSDKAHNGSKTKNLMTNNLGQSLREIQLEEERQIAAERRQESEMELRKKALISSPVSNASGKFAWGGQGARNLTWDQALSAPLSSPPPPPSSLFTATNAKKSAPKGAVWTSLLTSNQINTTSSSDTTTMNSSVSVTSDGFWDEEPFDQHIQHVQQKKQQKPQKSASSAIVQKKSVKPATTGNLKNNSEQNVMKHYLASSSQSTDEFSLWCIKQVKRLNKNIEESEAAVFVEFLKNVPDVEVPDYVLGHVPDSKASSQFVNDFVERRQKWRQSSAGGLTSSNEWSIVSKHLPTQNQGNSVTEPKMTLKKSKTKTSQQKNKVVDSKILGFRPAGDPNRVNVGEIDMPM